MAEKTRLRMKGMPESLNAAMWLALAFALTAFTLSGGVVLTLDSTGAFHRSDVLFDADCDARLLAMTEGLHLGIKHPNFSAFTTPPVTLAAHLLRRCGFSHLEAKTIRRRLGLMVVPLATAVKAWAFCLTLAALGLSLGRTVLVMTLLLLSPSNLIFGSVPETYGPASLGLAITYLLAVRRIPLSTTLRFSIWTAVAFFAMGVTITNVVTVGILFWSVERVRQGMGRALVYSLLLIALVFASTGVTSYLYDTNFPSKINARPEAPRGFPERTADAMSQARKLQTRFQPDAKERGLMKFPDGLVDTLLPAGLATSEREPTPQDRYPTRVKVTLEGTRDWGPKTVLGYLILIGMMTVGYVTAYREGPMFASLALGSLLTLLYNWGLHTVFGTEFFLYSQHWHLAMMLLLAGVIAGKRVARWRMLLFVLLLAAVAINDMVLGHSMYEALLK